MLVLGGSGGVGAMVIQLATHALLQNKPMHRLPHGSMDHAPMGYVMERCLCSVSGQGERLWSDMSLCGPLCRCRKSACWCSVGVAPLAPFSFFLFGHSASSFPRPPFRGIPCPVRYCLPYGPMDHSFRGSVLERWLWSVSLAG